MTCGSAMIIGWSYVRSARKCNMRCDVAEQGEFGHILHNTPGEQWRSEQLPWWRGADSIPELQGHGKYFPWLLIRKIDENTNCNSSFFFLNVHCKHSSQVEKSKSISFWPDIWSLNSQRHVQVHDDILLNIQPTIFSHHNDCYLRSTRQKVGPRLNGSLDYIL